MTDTSDRSGPVRVNHNTLITKSFRWDGWTYKIEYQKEKGLIEIQRTNRERIVSLIELHDTFVDRLFEAVLEVVHHREESPT